MPAAGGDRARRFIDAFRDIEQHLRTATRASDSADFQTLLNDAIDAFPGPRLYQHELRQFAMLRNAILHRPNRGGEPIADPRLDVVEQIEKIRTVLLSAPALLAVLSPGVTVTTATSSVDEASRRMLDGDFSQLPVLEDGAMVDLLTSDAISRWMASELRDHGRVLPETPVRHVAGYDSDRVYELVDRSATVLSALDLFAHHQRLGRMLHAILIAKRLPAGPLVAIATVTDLPAILAAADPFRWSRYELELPDGAATLRDES
jgi:predicted transcriptional regulator